MINCGGNGTCEAAFQGPAVHLGGATTVQAENRSSRN